MLLYHGTSATSLDHILREGLRPRVQTKRATNFPKAPSHADMTYLTDVYAPYFAANASHDDDWAVLEVEVDEADLLPDEDYLEQAFRRNSTVRGDMLQRTALYREMLHEYRRYALTSLQRLGTVAVEGGVPAARITRAVTFNWRANMAITLRACDPQISLLNHAICAQLYRGLTRWFFEPTEAQAFSTALDLLPTDAQQALHAAVADRSALKVVRP